MNKVLPLIFALAGYLMACANPNSSESVGSSGSTSCDPPGYCMISSCYPKVVCQKDLDCACTGSAACDAGVICMTITNECVQMPPGYGAPGVICN